MPHVPPLWLTFWILASCAGSGYIERPEVEAMLRKLGLLKADAPAEQLDKLMELADVDGDGRVSYEEVRCAYNRPQHTCHLPPAEPPLRTLSTRMRPHGSL